MDVSGRDYLTLTEAGHFEAGLVSVTTVGLRLGRAAQARTWRAPSLDRVGEIAEGGRPRRRCALVRRAVEYQGFVTGTQMRWDRREEGFVIPSMVRRERLPDGGEMEVGGYVRCLDSGTAFGARELLMSVSLPSLRQAMGRAAAFYEQSMPSEPPSDHFTMLWAPTPTASTKTCPSQRRSRSCHWS
ncbi:hypothetical protein BH24ACT5_BH24ACT5_15610 [soil metagenome]